jgi:hypothetical protein
MSPFCQVNKHHYCSHPIGFCNCPCHDYLIYEQPEPIIGPRRPSMPLYIILLSLLAVVPVRAQEALPASRVVGLDTHLTIVCGPTDGTIEWDRCMNIGPEFAPREGGGWHAGAYGGVGAAPNRRPHHTADKSWWAVNALSWASVVADVENTQYCFRAEPTCQESNPVFGSRHPSRARMYSIMAVPAAFTTWLSYKWKREDDRDTAILGRTAKIRWYIAPLIHLGGHGFAIGLTLVNTGR